MERLNIRIRDPFIFVENGTYYMYSCHGGKGLGVWVYKSNDLENFSEPIQCFVPPSDFWATQDNWAPEMHKFNGKYYLFVSYKSSTERRGTQIFKADSPEGPFRIHSDGPVTPREWECLDGTLYVDKNGTPYMIFCHEWSQVHNGEMCCIQLSDDLSKAVSEPHLMFKAGDHPLPAEIKALRIDNFYGKVTDGCFMYKTDSDRLIMIWSSVGENDNYLQLQAICDDGNIFGTWRHDAPPIFDKDGGHGMIFRDLSGKTMLSLHQPNHNELERAHFFEIKYNGEYLEIVK